jgi:hypothetical protein
MTSQGASLATFADVWASTPTPKTVQELTAAVQRVYTMSPKQLMAVFGSLSDEYRQYFHAQCIELSESVKNDMPELSLAATLLRWVLQTALPNMQAFPEDSLLGTTVTVQKNYSSLDYTCKIARPDDSNPEVIKYATQASQLQSVVQSKSNCNPAPPAPPPASKRDTYIFAALAALFFITAAVFIVLYLKKSDVFPTMTAGPAFHHHALSSSPMHRYASFGGVGNVHGGGGVVGGGDIMGGMSGGGGVGMTMSPPIAAAPTDIGFPSWLAQH